jgi:hypothetical protein
MAPTLHSLPEQQPTTGAAAKVEHNGKLRELCRDGCARLMPEQPASPVGLSRDARVVEALVDPEALTDFRQPSHGAPTED